jgi:D-cysteine desulfhydrase
MLELFKKFPRLRQSLPYKELGRFPTPVIRLSRLENELGKKGIFCKMDGMSSAIYGGNKIRKLEFLLGEAITRNSPGVVTFGCVGSNHALATAIYSNKIGMPCTLILFPQPNARSVRQNLLQDYAHNAHIVVCDDFSRVNFQTLEGVPGGGALRDRYTIPAGGSAPIGVVGYVNAAFELAQQIEAGILPSPDYIFLPFGTMGTAAGLAIGCKAAGLRTKIVAVRVVNTAITTQEKFDALVAETLLLIRGNDETFPCVTVTTADCAINHAFFGSEYARYTPESVAAVRLLRKTDAIALEGTYSGKAMAACIDFCQQPEHADATVLFWNTYNASPLPDLSDTVDYKKLPEKCWWYFEHEVQELDREDRY